MAKTEKIEAIMKRAAMKNDNKASGQLTDNDTTKRYRQNIHKFCEWALEKGVKREADIERMGYSPRTLIQAYTNELKTRDLKATSIHSYIAPVCKGLGVSMSEIDKPSRLSADIVKNQKLHQNERGAREAANPANERIVRFAEVVTIRPQALVKLTIDNLVTDEDGNYYIKAPDKGGKTSIQLILPHEVKFVRDTLTHGPTGEILGPGERPFRKSDVGHIAFNKYRIERAQAVERHFNAEFNAWRQMPTKTVAERQARQNARERAETSRSYWRSKMLAEYKAGHPNAAKWQIERWKKSLYSDSKYVIRAGNKERALKLGRPLEYDRTSLKIASIYCLSHWEDETTVRNYLTK